MNGVARLDSVCDRERMVELSYSLYECLSDLITDTEELQYATDDDVEGIVERITISAMNCLADMGPLSPILVAVRKLRG
jgi:hypothetical protein